MMRQLMKNIIGMFLLLTVFSACSNENELPVDKLDGEYITLGLSKQTLARASEPGDDAYNENTISKVDIFFYKSGNCVFYPENVTLNSDNTVTIKVPSSEIQLFDGGPYTVYVIANGTFTREELQNKSIDELKNMSISTTFTADADNRFLMDGMSEGISLTKNGSSGNVDLYRAAAKITLEVKVNDSVTGEDGITWAPIKDQMTISLCNGVNKTHINTADYPYTINPESDFFTTDNRVITEEEKGHTPFYSYPNEWNTNPKNETYLLLTVPWSSAENSFQHYYYRIPINNQYKKLVRNSLYKIKLNVSILGSTVKEEPVDLNPNYLILNWSTKEIPTDLEDFKYLVLDKNFVVMNNVNDISIGYASSSDITEAKITYVEIPDYSQIKIGNKNDASPSSGIYIVKTKNGNVTVTHDIPTYKDNQGKDRQIVVPYTMILSVTNKDGFNETATIIQYPAIYIEANINSGYEGTEGSNNKTDSDRYGYAWVNGKRGSSTDFSSLQGVYSGSNHNPNMYVINVTTFAESEYNWKAGDPRSTSIDNLITNSATAPHIYNNKTNNILSYYYPSRLNTSSIIAPSFRIASSYGQTSSISFDIAKKRCATYQEDGRAAGRWRVPTEAEVEFIAGLSGDGQIPMLFTYNKNYRYWASSQQAFNAVDKDFTQPNSAYVRCVYDEWYWTDTCNKTQFTWGDKQR